jgi:arsenate reductase
MNRSNLLFLCTGNSCRSQMAEALLRAYAGDRFEVYSAGLKPTQINPYTYRVMAERGLDLAGQYAKHVQEYKGAIDFDTVITVCDDANELCPVYLGKARHRLHWGFEDPAQFKGSDQAKLAKFRQVRDVIDTCIKGWLENEN